jgi:tetratricopeptide (TPR) repeat protein
LCFLEITERESPFLTVYVTSAYEDAEKMYFEAIQKNKNFTEAYLRMGNLYNEWGRTQDAVTAYEIYFTLKLLTKKSGDIHASLQLARLYMMTNKSNEAYLILKNIVTLDPNKKQEILWIGEIYEKINKTDEAVQLFKQTLEKNPNNIEAYMELTWYYLNNNMLDEAEKMYDKVMQINSGDLIRIYENLATRYQKKGMLDRADAMFQRGADLRRKYYNPTTLKNYRELYGILNERGIKLVAMQYPNLDVDELKGIFTGKEGIIFVSNEENFRKAFIIIGDACVS